jgi:hypothetical protein
MAASGTTKKVTVNQILGAGGTATLASATITGDLTVDTNVLKVNTTTDRVGINTASPNNTLTVRGTQDAGIEVNSADSNSSRLIFAYDPANTRWYINSTLSGSGTTRPLAFLIQNTEVARFNTTGNLAFATGKGIDFTAVTGGTGTATANVLNDYEEGTFTPTVVGSTTAGTATYSPGAQNGYYTKVGRLVTVQVYMVWSGHTGTGNMRFAGLPFNTANITSNYASVSFGLVSSIALTANNILTGHTELNNSFINALQTPAGGGGYTLVPIDPAGELLFTCSYIAA